MMIPMLALLLPAALCAAEEAPAPHISIRTSAVASDSLREVYAAGQRWPEFYASINRRRELWQNNWTNAKVPDSVVARARAAGAWRVLVITEPGCSDSANSLPYIARLVESAPGIELRLVNSTVGKPWMERYRTPDGRAATPTLLVLDDQFNVVGCWVEQPKALQDFWLPIVARKETSSRFEEKMAWYVKDEGREILREVVETLEGKRRCN
jgi:hypothetical protein